MLKNLIASLIFLVLIGACSREEISDPQIELEEIYVTEEDQELDILLSSIISNYEILPIKPGDEADIFMSAKILAYDDLYFILDRDRAKKVIYYDINTFESKVIGGIGRGPGEYTSADDMYLNRVDNELIILDRVQRKLIYYSLEDFSVVRESSLPFAVSRFIRDDNYYYFLSHQREKLIIVTDLDYSIVREYVEHDISHFYRSLNSFYKSGDKIVYHNSISPILYKFENGRQVEGNIIQFSSGNVSEEVFESREDLEPVDFITSLEDYKTMFLPLGESSSYLYFTYTFQGNQYFVLYNKYTQEVTSNNNYVDDITFQEFFPMIIGVDHDDYFLSIIFKYNIQNDELMNSFLRNHSLSDETEYFFFRFKIDEE